MENKGDKGKRVAARGKKIIPPRVRTAVVGEVRIDIPTFTAGHREQFAKLNVPPHVMTALENTLFPIQHAITPGPKMIDVEDRIEEIEKLAKALMKKLKAGGLALSYIGNIQFGTQLVRHRARTDDAVAAGGEPPKFDHYDYVKDVLLPVLDGLVNHASAAKDVIPVRKAGRPNTASPYPVQLIRNALLEKAWQLDELPMYLTPSKAENHPFRQIVGICYEAAGSPTEPVRAIEAFLAAERTKENRFQESLAADF